MDIVLLYIQLFVTFFQIGLFGFGGGYGMLSLIQTKVVPDWITTGQFTDIVAISQMTPGPIGINSATYCGYMACHNAGLGTSMSILGSCVATFALVLPSLILMIIIAKMFIKYMNTMWQFCISVVLFVATFIGTKVYKVNPIHMIAMAGFAGLLLLY